MARAKTIDNTKRRMFPSHKGYVIALILTTLIGCAFLISLILVDAFPTDLTFLFVSVMTVLLVLICTLFASRKKAKRIIGILIAVVFAAVFSFGAGFMGSTYAMLNKISDGGSQAVGPTAKKVNVTEEPFNIYVTGIDQWASEKGLDLERSDVNMLITVNPTTKKVLLTSIPRDTYVELYTAKQMDKLTHTGIYGVEETIKTAEKWLGIPINYYVKMNFTGMCAIIDALDGIDVYSPVAFESSIKGYSFDKGWNHLYGRSALYFARERKSFEGQDEMRVENQQRVVKAIIKKMTSSTTLLTRYGSVMDAAGENLTTNMSSEEMRELVKMQVTELAEWDVETQKIEGEVSQEHVASLSSANVYDVYKPDEKSVKACTDHAREIMNPSEEELKEANMNRNRSFFINAGNRMIRKLTKKDKDRGEINV